jgi:hypothetical protein
VPSTRKIARAFVASFLRKTAASPVEQWDDPAWSDSQREAVMGTYEGEQLARYPAISMRDDSPSTLYYDVYGTGTAPWQAWNAVSGKCSNGVLWGYMPTHNV